MNRTNTPVTIRPATGSDAPAMLEIYAPYVTETAVTFEYGVPALAEFRERIGRISARYPWLAAVDGNEITGYAYASPFKERAAYDWAVETTVYVKRERHGEGIGRILYEALEKALERQNIINLNACITYPNPESIRFHEKSGYRKVAHFSQCGYKLGRWYDMIWMEKTIGEHAVPPEPVIPFPETTGGGSK